MLLILTDNGGDRLVINTAQLSSIEPIRKFEIGKEGSILRMSNGSKFNVPASVDELFKLLTRNSHG